MSRLLRSALLAAVVASAACAHPATSPYAPTVAPRVLDVVVDNQYVNDVRVYLVRGDTPILLGSVGSFTRRTFKVDAGLLPTLDDVQLRVRAMDGVVYNAPPVMVNPGNQVLWTLGPRLKLSSIAVR